MLLEFHQGKYRYFYNQHKPGPQHLAALVSLAAQVKGSARTSK